MNTTKTKIRTMSRRTERANVGTELSRVTVGATGLAAGLIGLWSVACFIGGLVEAGGPVELAKSWLAAVTGM